MHSVSFKVIFSLSVFLVLLALAITGLVEVFSSIEILVKPRSFTYSLLIGSVSGLVLFLIIVMAVSQLGKYFSDLHDIPRQLYALFHQLNYFQIIILSILAGVGEELLFRGLLQQGLIYLTSPWIGIIIASLIFGLFHSMNRAYVGFAFIAGLFFGYLYYLTSDIYFVMILHAVYDVFAFIAIIKFPHWFDVRLCEPSATINNE